MEPVFSKMPGPLLVGSEKSCTVLRGSQFFGDFPENEISLLVKYLHAASSAGRREHG